MDIMEEYDKNHNIYVDFLSYFKDTVNRILTNESINIQSIDSRVKDRNSLEKKIKTKKKYKSIDEITDICGIRVITYFTDDVNRIASFLKSEFEIDEANSIDKRNIEDPTKFGYVSLHYIVSLKENRASLAELRPFKGLKIEVQIRTILQHAWAEIEHDLGYKTAVDIPINIRRSFSRLASIIELADEEFVRIKSSMQSYSEQVKLGLESNNHKIRIDVISILTFLTNDADYLKFSKKMAKELNLPLDNDVESKIAKNIISRIIVHCGQLGIDSIGKMKEVFFKYAFLLPDLYEKEKNGGLAGIGLISPLISVFDTILNSDKGLLISEEEFKLLYDESLYEELFYD